MKQKMITTPYDSVDAFEKAIAEYAGSKYAVAVDSCCNALFLCCVYKEVKYVSIPRRTYPGVACSIIHAGGKIILNNHQWKGLYTLAPYKIIDGALRFKKGMYIKGSFHCLSFHVKKHLPIGRGGMILLDDERAYKWFKKARFDGRDSVPLSEDRIDVVGWNCYMTPEQASRGLTLFNVLKDKLLPDIDSQTQGYPDLGTIEVYRCKNK